MIKLIIIGIITYLAIDDFINLDVSLICLILLHLAIFIYNPFFILILPFYFLLYKINIIGMADWIGILFGLYETNNIVLFTLTLCITSICFAQKNKCPLYPGILFGILIS
jgi:hypothetical protein